MTGTKKLSLAAILCRWLKKIKKLFNWTSFSGLILTPIRIRTLQIRSRKEPNMNPNWSEKQDPNLNPNPKKIVRNPNTGDRHIPFTDSEPTFLAICGYGVVTEPERRF